MYVYNNYECECVCVKCLVRVHVPEMYTPDWVVVSFKTYQSSKRL